MVGVAGKSKACNTCRKRRVKCDLRRPSCLTCLKSHRTCTGYERSLVFVNRTATDLSLTAADVLSDLKQKRLLSEEPASSLGPEHDLQALFLDAHARHDKFRAYAAELVRDLYLPRPVFLSLEDSHGAYSWATVISSLDVPCASLDVALYTFCLVQIHLVDAGSASLERCLRWYDEALQRLRADIESPDTRYSDELLAAIVLTTTTELFITPPDEAWHTHARGIAEIVKSREPGNDSPRWRHLLARLRVVCVLEALTKRRASVIDSDVWRQKEDPAAMPGQIDILFEVLADIPAVLELIDTVCQQPDRGDFLNYASILVRTLFGFINRIQAFLEEIRSASPTKPFWSIPSTVVSPVDSDLSGKIFPFSLEFVSLSVGIAMNLAWVGLVQLHSDVIRVHYLVTQRVSPQITLRDLLDHSRDNEMEAACTLLRLNEAEPSWRDPEDPTIEFIRTEATKYARLVCQAMEYHHRVESGVLGPQATSYPRWTLRYFFTNHLGHERELAWVQHMRQNEGPGTRWHLKVTGFADLPRREDRIVPAMHTA